MIVDEEKGCEEMFSLDDAHLFARVVEHGGFTAAARATGLPKSTLSKRIGALETQLGVRLLHRNVRGLSLSEAGEQFHRHVAAMLIEAEAAEARIKGHLAEPRGTVRLTASNITAQYHLSAILPDIAWSLPQVRIVLHATDRVVDIVQESFDLALRDHHEPLPSSDLAQRHIGIEPDFLVAAPAYLDRAGMPARAEDLGDHDGLADGPALKSFAWQLADGGDGACRVAPRLRFVADDPATLVRAALSGLGITALPRSVCAAHIADGSLVHVLPGWTAGGAATTLLMPHRRGQLPSVRAVADAIVRLLRERLGAV